jgi:tRNA(Ile2) C34 agmatinyltransferase TiaS
LEGDFVSFCKLNNIENIEEFRFDCFKKGYYIQKYGLLGEDDEIKPWEVIVEKEVIKEVEKEVVVNADCKECNEKLEMIGYTLQSLRTQINEKDEKLKQQEIKINDLSGIITSRLARFHPGSNLKDKI